MLHGLIGRGSIAPALKEALDASSQEMRRIAHRVANASTPGFSDALAGAAAAGAEGEGVDLEKEMVALADEQIRFEATSRLLQKVYAQVRASVRERG
ncbi:MAG TPA: hypothetical protein VKZ58_02010 [Longimicrobiales bacterium]|nr:hypothetical protein [Longimicrobiales bacterium]